MSRIPSYRKVEPGVYEYRGYRIEKMADGRWDAYLLNAWGDRIWSSPAHRTRSIAAEQISGAIRRDTRDVATALRKAAAIGKAGGDS